MLDVSGITCPRACKIYMKACVLLENWHDYISISMYSAILIPQMKIVHLFRQKIGLMTPCYFFRGNINIYLHFVSFLHIDMTQVLNILPKLRPGPTYSTKSISSLRRQDISSHSQDIDLVKPRYLVHPSNLIETVSNSNLRDVNLWCRVQLRNYLGCETE